MNNRMLTMIVFALITQHVDTKCPDDVQDKCSKTPVHEYIYPVVSFFEKLTKVMEQSSLWQDCHSETKQEDQGTCLPFSDSNDFQHGTCYSERLLEIFDVKLKAEKNDKEFCIKVKAESVSVTYIEIIKKLCCKMYSSFSTPDSCSCTPCNTKVPGNADDYTLTTPKRSGVTDYGTTSDAIQNATQNSSCQDKERLEESHIIIASVVSFLGGALSTLIMVCVLKYLSKRNENGQDAPALQPEMLEDKKGNHKVDQKTYESLTRAESVTTSQPPSDHEYLSLGTTSKLNKLSDANMVEENAKQIKTNDARKKSHAYEQNDGAGTEYHVYNALESKSVSNLYEDTKPKEKTEHTYTGLATRDVTHQSIKQDISIPELHNDESGYGSANYFLLENKSTETTNKETEETHQIESQAKEVKEDDKSAVDHAYITLEIDENLGCSIQEVSDEHDYSTLEKV